MVHILNGDGTYYPFSKADISGDVIIWREGLALGPVSADLNENRFWNDRIDFWKTYETVSNDLPDYKEFMLPEWHKLQNLNDQEEVNLWFEYDLFCQINLLAILAWVHDNNKKFDIHLICINSHPGLQNFKGLGQLSPGQLKSLLPKKVKINHSDLRFASGIWKNYCSTDPMNLWRTIHESPFPGSLAFLKDAMLLHFYRFPSTFNGTNEVENKAMEMLKTGVKDGRAFVREMLLWDNKYGFGDLEYFFVLDNFKTIINHDGLLNLNTKGMKILNGEKDLSDDLKSPKYLGGVKIKPSESHWRWSQTTQELIMV